MELSTVFAVDIGKSQCRIQARHGAGVDAAILGQAELAGFPGLAAADGVREARDLIHTAVKRLREETDVSQQPGSVGAALAGVAANVQGARTLAAILAEDFGCPVSVLSDATSAQMGAFRGEPGVVLIMGTGAVAFRFDQTGSLLRSDGWGPLLGDRGSGRWLGQQGLDAVLQAHDGGPETLLSDPAFLPVPVPSLATWLSAEENPYRAMASFAPRVLEASMSGDPVAERIARDGAQQLKQTILRVLHSPGTGHSRAQDDSQRVALLGGLSDSAHYSALVATELREAGIAVVPARGNGLDGAALATLPERLQERYIYRGNP